MKNRFAKFVAVAVLAGFTLCGATAHAEAKTKEPSTWGYIVDKAGIAGDVYDVVDGAVNGGAGGAAKAAVKVAASSAVTNSATSAAVGIAGAAGMTAKTGTAITTLSGAAAAKATLCAIGTPVVATLGLPLAPAVVGGAIVAGGAAAVAWGVGCLIDCIW